MWDLLIKGGRIIDPANGLDTVMDVAFEGGKVAAVGPDLDTAQASATKNASGCLVTPGLIDLHTHIYWGGTSLGVNPDDYARHAGTTTLVDAGSTGAANIHGFRKHVIEPAEARIYAYLNVSYPGIFAFGPKVMVGECGDLRLLNVYECLDAVRANADLIVGVKVRVGYTASDGIGVAPLDLALEVADEAGVAVMCHLDNPPPTRMEVLARLRPGDVLTHCFRPFPGSPATARGEVREEVIAAKEKGIIFDIGHGKGSFGFVTAEAMLAAGFYPDCISSDVHVLSIDGPAYDQLITMSKLLNLGMPLDKVIAASTCNPAAAIGHPELGTLSVGAPGDASILRIEEGQFEFTDATDATRTDAQRFGLEAIVLDGRVWT